MADDATPPRPTGFTLDLSTGKEPRRRKRKGPPPVVQQTINLSTKPAAQPPAPAPSGPTSTSKRQRSRSDDGSRGRGASVASSSLADLLDPETLAKLRGGG